MDAKEIPDSLKHFIASSKWTFAKTYAATWPHEYIVQEQVDNDLYLELARHIDTYGYKSYFYRTPQTYFNYGGHAYWHMDNIINRCAESESYDRRKAEGRLPEDLRPESLLGHLRSRIRGSAEDIASEGLAYILNRSSGARQAIFELIKEGAGVALPELKYATQDTGVESERPDISGRDAGQIERIIIEAKFWSSLTKNQPNTYLKRMGQDTVLLFICPDMYARPLYSEVWKRVENKFSGPIQKPAEHKITIPERRQTVLIRSWGEILGAIRDKLAREGSHVLLSDLHQIVGFYEHIENTSFKPVSAEDLSPQKAIDSKRDSKNMESFYAVAEKAVQELIKRDVAHTRGFLPRSSDDGLTRYFGMDKIGAVLYVSLEYWRTCGGTPFWIAFEGGHNSILKPTPSRIFEKKISAIANIPANNAVRDANGDVIFGLVPLIGRTEDAVVSDMADQIIALRDQLP